MGVDSWKGLKELPVTEDDADAGAFQKFLEAMEDKQKQITYLVMVATEVIEGFDVKSTHPYSFFYYKKTGYKKLFQPNKNIVVNEMKRRDPNAKPNQNNRTNEELLAMLKERWPLSEKDTAYVIKKEGEYRKLLQAALTQGEHYVPGEAVTPSGTPAQGKKRPSDANDLATPGARKRSRETVPHIPIAGAIGGVRIDQINDLVETLGQNVSQLAFGNLVHTIEGLKKEKFELLQKSVGIKEGVDSEQKKLIDDRIKELTDSIQKYSEQIDKDRVVAL